MSQPAVTFSIYMPTSTAVTAYTNTCTIDRGRPSPVFEDIDRGTASAQLNNEDRRFDPLYASSPYLGHTVPGRRAVITAAGVTVFDGFVTDWNYDYDILGRSVAIVQTEDALGKLARASFDEWTTTNGELPGARLTSVMARPEVNYTGTTAFDTGAFALAGDTITWDSNVLNYAQLIARTDFGLFFVSRSGVLTFKDRLSFHAASSAATFGTSGIGFSAITTSYGAELLYNRVSVDRVKTGDVDPEPVSASDATSISAYDGTYTLALNGLLLQDEATAQYLADNLLSYYKDPLYRFESITVDVHGLTGGQQTTVLSLDIGSVVTVTWTPNSTGSAISRTCVVEGIRHQVTPDTYTLEFTLNDTTTTQTQNVFILEDNTYGLIDGTGTFAYPLAF